MVEPSTRAVPGGLAGGDARARAAWGVLFAVVVAVLAVHLALTRYAYPAADDWGYIAGSRDLGWWAVVTNYLRFNAGRWTFAIIYHLLAVVGDLPAWYPTLVLGLQGLLVGGAWLFVARLPLPRVERGGLAAAVAAVLLAAMPTLAYGTLGWITATPETLYWLPGGCTYALAMPGLALAAWAALAPGRARPGSRMSWLAAALGVAVAGLSEMSGLGAVAVGLALAVAGVRRAWWLFGGACVGIGLCALAPGNYRHIADIDVQTVPLVDRLPRAALFDLQIVAHDLWGWATCAAVLGALLVAAGLGSRSASAAGAEAWEPGRWRRAAVALATAVPVTVGLLAAPTVLFVGFLEARHQGIIALLAVPMALGAAWCAGRGWPGLSGLSGGWRWAAGGVIAALCIAGPCLSPLEVPAWGPWCAVAGGVVALGAIMGWCRRAAWGAPLLVAAGLAMSPSVWRALDDLPRASALSALQHQRDHAVGYAASLGCQRVAVPFLGRRDQRRVPRTIELYELQPGWMVEGYARYYRLHEVVLADVAGVVALPPADPAPGPVPASGAAVAPASAPVIGGAGAVVPTTDAGAGR
jgi:hypothetical protein